MILHLGILGTADIAYRRFLPALCNQDDIEYIGIASRNIEKTKKFVTQFGGKPYASYDDLLKDETINAVYIPLPPALHYDWARKALEYGKHVLLEKPFTVDSKKTEQLIELANKKDLVLHENYMFLYHKQLKLIKEYISDDVFGETRLIRTAFGFPFRGAQDFRYSKALGGGALLDCGGYPVRLALELLGEKAEVVNSQLKYSTLYGVDLYGNAVLKNENDLVVQISFGMDNSYKCELEIWGSKGCLKAPRIFTAPSNFEAAVILELQNEIRETLVVDNQFLNSINWFYESAKDSEKRKRNYTTIMQQARLIDQIKEG